MPMLSNDSRHYDSSSAVDAKNETGKENTPEQSFSAVKSKKREADVEYEEELKQDTQNVPDEDYEEYISANQTDDMIRNNIRDAIRKCLLKVEPRSAQKIQYIATKIEVGLIKKYGKSSKDYSNRARSVLFNLRRSDEFKSKILCNAIEPETVALMDPKEMLDTELAKKREKMEKDIVDSKRSDYLIATAKIQDGMYTCKKCKGKKTTFYEQQTRSADEPMTVFVHCLDCDHKMKF